MMNKIIVSFIFLFVPNIVVADNYIQNHKDFFNQELSIIEERIKKTNPELVESVKNDSDEIKIIKYNNWLAKNTFDDFRDFFVWKLEKQSETSGRKVRTAINLLGPNSQEYWLDRGVLDEEKCNGGTYVAKNNSRHQINKELRDMRRYTCLYPDGFEEFSIEYINNEQDASLIVAIDDKIKGLHTEYYLFLNNDMYVDQNTNYESATQSIIFSVESAVYDYTEYHNWRNQGRQDIKDGMYSYVPRKKQKCNTLGCITKEVKDIEKWKSAKLPGYKVEGKTHDMFISYDKNW